jgi:ADP-heptose:LPS heptosyltransferase
LNEKNIVQQKILCNLNNILTVSIGGLGDTILFSPVLMALKKSYPEAHIELLVANRLAEEVYSQAHQVSNVTYANLNHSFSILKIVYLLCFIFKNKFNRKFDIGLFATGLNKNIGRLFKYTGFIKDVMYAPMPQSYATDFDCNLKLANLINETVSKNDVFVPLREEFELEATKILNEHGISKNAEKLIAICPSTKLKHRPRWDLINLLKLVKILKSKSFKSKFVVMGSASEGKEWDLIDSDSIIDANLAGKLSILGSASVVQKCALVVGNDGGLMHVAGAFGRPIVMIMTNTPSSYRPPGEKVKIIHSKHTCCNGLYPNRPKDCKIAKCTEDIHIVEVIRNCISFLG